jgi:hypothetical protein
MFLGGCCQDRKELNQAYRLDSTVCHQLVQQSIAIGGILQRTTPIPHK